MSDWKGKDSSKTSARAAEAMRRSQPYLDAVWMLVGGVGVGLWAGFELDKRLGTKPWLMVVGAVLGMTTGFIGFFKKLLQLGKNR